MTITKGERTELKSMVRQQFKVLRAEIVQRKAELYAEIESEIGERYRDRDHAWEGAEHEIHEAVMEANRKINDALRKANVPIKRLRGDGGGEREYLNAPYLDVDQSDRYNERRIAEAKIEAMVKGAMLQLDRQEADLVRTLTIGALESAEAKAFLVGIPTVGELVSMARLAELEKAVES